MTRPEAHGGIAADREREMDVEGHVALNFYVTSTLSCVRRLFLLCLKEKSCIHTSSFRFLEQGAPNNVGRDSYSAKYKKNKVYRIQCKQCFPCASLPRQQKANIVCVFKKESPKKHPAAAQFCFQFVGIGFAHIAGEDLRVAGW